MTIVSFMIGTKIISPNFEGVFSGMSDGSLWADDWLAELVPAESEFVPVESIPEDKLCVLELSASSLNSETLLLHEIKIRAIHAIRDTVFAI